MSHVYLRDALFSKKGIILKIVIFSCIVVLFSCLMGVLIATLVYNRRWRSVSLVGNIGIFKYKYTRVNLNTNGTEIGFVSMFRQLEEDEYISYNDQAGNSNLISNFGNNEYYCTGSCVCGVGERRNSNILTHGIFYLVASVSLFIALDKAKGLFRDGCLEEMSDSCTSNSIESVVESCELVGDGITEETKLLEDFKGDRFPRRYFCYGNCMNNNKIRTETSKELMMKKNCESIQIEGEVEFYSTLMFPNELNQHARKVFRREYLVPMCKVKSSEKYFYVSPSTDYFRWNRISLCVGSQKGRDNPSTHCRQTYPDYKKGYGNTARNRMKHWG